MDWSLIIGSSGLAGIGYLVFKIGRFTQKLESFIVSTSINFESIDKRFDKIDIEIKDIKSDIKEIKKDIHSIDVRLAVLEAENIFYNCIPEPNTRSEAAKEMWKRKKQKKLELQESNK